MNFVRLKKRAEFVSVSKNRQSVFMPHFIFQYLEKPQQTCPRFGFTASKKVGNAVVRNRVKRRLREVVRLSLKNSDPAYFSNFPFDCVIVGRTSAARASFTDLQIHFNAVIDRLKKSANDPLTSDHSPHFENSTHALSKENVSLQNEKETSVSFRSHSQQSEEDVNSLDKGKKSSTKTTLCSP